MSWLEACHRAKSHADQRPSGLFSPSFVDNTGEAKRKSMLRLPWSPFQKLLLLLVILLLLPASAFANCTLSTSAVNFGTYSGNALSFTGSVTVASDFFGCGNSVSVSIGLGSSTGYAPRNFSGAAPQLQYTLYQNAAHTILWGSGGNAQSTSITGSSQQNLTVYGVMAAGQGAPTGSFSDSLVASATANGGTINSTSLPVTATVAASCTISSNSLAFGIYTGAQIDTTTLITVDCTSSTAWYVNMSDGNNPGPGFVPRMTGPNGNVMSYSKYRDSARTLYWGNSYNYDGVSGTGTGLAQPLTVYARLFGGANGTPGAYSDTITVKVTF